MPGYFTEPPTLSSLPSQQVDIDSTLTFNVAAYASDPNTPPLPLTYSLGTGPHRGRASTRRPASYLDTIVQSGDRVDHVPRHGQRLPHTAKHGVAKLDGPGLRGGHTIRADGRADSDQQAIAGQELQLNVSQFVSNPSQLTLTYSVNSTFFSPTGTSINPTTGLFTWTPTSSQLGDYQVSINVANSQTASVTATFSVDVTQYALPVLEPIPAQTATVGQPFSLAVSQYASDPNASPEPLTYSLGGFSPAVAHQSVNRTIDLDTVHV